MAGPHVYGKGGKEMIDITKDYKREDILPAYRIVAEITSQTAIIQDEAGFVMTEEYWEKIKPMIERTFELRGHEFERHNEEVHKALADDREFRRSLGPVRFG